MGGNSHLRFTMASMTFHELSTNPSGKGSAAFARRGLIISDLKKRVEYRNKKDGIELKVYKTPNNVFVLFFRLMSETIPKLWYDVVITLTPPEVETTSRTVADYTCKFASNMPSFAYSYLYVAHKRELFLESFKDKFPSIFFEKAPEIRNPDEGMGFEKSILFCLYYMTLKKYHFIDTLDLLSKGPPSLVVLKSKFMTFPRKMQERKKLEAEHKKKQQKAGLKFKANKKGSLKVVKVKKAPKPPKQTRATKKTVSKKLPK